MKGMFSYMNYLCRSRASLRCTARPTRTRRARRPIFFGLSGTGKSFFDRLKRQLIGDDEHGWDDDGVFNFEGNYAAPRVINLGRRTSRTSGNAIRRNALLENVTVDKEGARSTSPTSR